MYSVMTEDPSEAKKKAKGVQKRLVKSVLTHENYKEVYESGRSIRSAGNKLVSKKHEIRTVRMNKTSLSLFCNKRYWLDANTSLAYGHYVIPELDEADNGGDRDAPRKRVDLEEEEVGSKQTQITNYFPTEKRRAEGASDAPPIKKLKSKEMQKRIQTLISDHFSKTCGDHSNPVHIKRSE